MHLWKRNVSPVCVAGPFVGKVTGQDTTVSVQPDNLIFINSHEESLSTAQDPTIQGLRYHYQMGSIKSQKSKVCVCLCVCMCM